MLLGVALYLGIVEWLKRKNFTGMGAIWVSHPGVSRSASTDVISQLLPGHQTYWREISQGLCATRNLQHDIKIP